MNTKAIIIIPASRFEGLNCYANAQQRFATSPILETVEYYLDHPDFENGYDASKPVRVIRRGEGTR